MADEAVAVKPEEFETPITLNDLLQTNLERSMRWHGGNISEWSALEWAGAMAGEAGEACNAAKKMRRLEGKAPSINNGVRHYADVESAAEAVMEEVADTILYGVMLVARVGCRDFESVLRRVFNRKSEEYGFPERL